MEKRIEAYSPEESPVKIVELDCRYLPYKEAGTIARPRPEGVHVNLSFSVMFREKSGKEKYGVEAVEFTLVLLDIFDHFLQSVQGMSGPGNYPASRKVYKSGWVFDFEGGFSMYHAFGFPSQARMFDGTIWRADKAECIEWVNQRISDAGIVLGADDIYPDFYSGGSADISE